MILLSRIRCENTVMVSSLLQLFITKTGNWQLLLVQILLSWQRSGCYLLSEVFKKYLVYIQCDHNIKHLRIHLCLTVSMAGFFSMPCGLHSYNTFSGKAYVFCAFLVWAGHCSKIVLKTGKMNIGFGQTLSYTEAHQLHARYIVTNDMRNLN